MTQKIIGTILDNCICGHEMIPGESYCSQDTAMCELMPVLNEVHVSTVTHEEKIELKQPSFPLKPNLFCPLQYRLLSHIVIEFHLRAGGTLPLPS